MAFVSITRLRIRKRRFMPRFLLLTWRSFVQVKRAPGFRGGSLLADRARTYWTMTVWDDRSAMRTYMTAGPHKAAMPFLLDWCDEASVVHWDEEGGDLPSWTAAAERIRGGRASRVRHPGPNHAALAYPAPRLTGAVPIRARRTA